MSRAARFGAVFATLYAAHQVGDHWVQQDREACTKAADGREGQLACARHVATYTATAAAALAATNRVTGAGINPGRALIALGLSAVTHYAIDRGPLLRAAAERTGNGRLYVLGAPRPGRDDNPTLGTGRYALDQSAHVAFLFAAALIASGGRKTSTT